LWSRWQKGKRRQALQLSFENSQLLLGC
jgi:hypothetical protein